MAGDVPAQHANGDSHWPNLDELRSVLLGDVFLPGSPDYEAGVAAWHQDPLRGERPRPRVLLMPRGTLDCQKAVKWAVKHGYALSVKSGGHSPNNACIAGEVCLMLGHMRGVYVDAAARVAYIDGGALLGDVDAETAVYGLAMPLGHAPITGMGLVLNGGIGIASKKYGPSSDHILSLTVVLADGSVVEANQEQHRDLFWAMRGVGSAFGVVTKMQCRLHDVSDCLGGTFILPYDKEITKKVARFMMEVGWKHPELCGTLFAGQPPGLPQVLILQLMYFGKESREQKLAFLDPVRQLPVMLDTFGTMSYHQVQDHFRPNMHQDPERRMYGTAGGFGVGEVTPQMLDRVCDEVISAIPPNLSKTVFSLDWWYSPAISTSTSPIGFKHKELAMLLLVEWNSAEHNAEGIAFAQHCRRTVKGMSKEGGIYANIDTVEPDMISDEGIAKRVGGYENLARLRELKSGYDPDNVFRRHHFQGLVLDKDKADVASA